MELIGGLLGETVGVFEFLRDFFGLLPTAVRILTYAAFGGVLYISMMKMVR